MHMPQHLKHQFMKLGEIIKKKVEESGLKVSAFAQKINVSRNNVYDIYDRETVDTGLLFNISKVLDYDFFQHLDPLNLRGQQQNLLNEPEVKYVLKREEILMQHIENLERKLEECEKEKRQMFDS